jgi:DNA-binding transcriptional MerR regulator
MNESKERTFSIGDTAKITSVSKKQIRNWEARGYIPEAERVVCGERAYRYFTNDQVGIIKKIKSYLDQGYTLKHASGLSLTEELEQDFY